MNETTENNIIHHNMFSTRDERDFHHVQYQQYIVGCLFDRLQVVLQGQREGKGERSEGALGGPVGDCSRRAIGGGGGRAQS